jgi:hypothetical protein
MNTITRTAMSAAALSALLMTGAAQAAFQGRNASNQVDNTCTVSGATKCTSFYDTTLGITILNNWNIGAGFWDATAAAGSAQALAASAGFAATGLTGWVLPTGDGVQPAGAANQYLSIWNDAGGSLSGLSSKFDGVRSGIFWSGTEYAPFPSDAWFFFTFDGGQVYGDKNNGSYAVAVLPGDVAAVPEPQTVALLMMGLGVLTLVRRRRPR